MEAMSGITATSPASRSVTGRTPTTTAPSQRSTTMGIMDMSHHGMGMNMGSCKVTMLWNWNTSDACFVSSSWRITSDGMFAGSCIAVICLVVCLEFLRRCGKEYDRHLIRQHMAAYKGFGVSVIADAAGELDAKNDSGSGVSVPAFRPNVAQQAVRALLHMVQFAVAYLVMLLAMYCNGYIIICIFFGAYIGSFFFHWESIIIGGQTTGAANDATICCG